MFGCGELSSGGEQLAHEGLALLRLAGQSLVAETDQEGDSCAD